VDRLKRKFDNAKPLVPAPVVLGDDARGILAFGSSDPAVVEAVVVTVEASVLFVVVCVAGRGGNARAPRGDRASRGRRRSRAHPMAGRGAGRRLPARAGDLAPSRGEGRDRGAHEARRSGPRLQETRQSTASGTGET